MPTPTGRRTRREWVIAAVAIGVLVLAACGTGTYLVARSTIAALRPSAASDEAQVRALVEDFAVAVDRDDPPAILNLLCAAEVEELMQDDDFDSSQPASGNPPPVRPVTVADISVTGDVARARVSRPGQSDATLHFRKENGAWKVCAPAGEQARPGPGPSD